MHLDRPLPVLHEGESELGENDFSKIPNGAPGVETRMSLVYDGGVRPGRISLNRFVELTSTSPAKIFGLFPRKGTIAPGSDADIVVFDPNRTITLAAKTLHMNVRLQPVRRPSGDRRHRHRALARPPRDRERGVRRSQGCRVVPETASLMTPAR